MAISDDLNNLEQQIERLESTITSLSASLSASIKSQFKDVEDISSKTAEKYRQDLTKNANFLKGALEKEKKLRESIIKGQSKGTQAAKELQKLEGEVRRRKEANLRIANNLTKEGIYLDQEKLIQLEETADEILSSVDKSKELNTEAQKSKSLFSLLRENATSFANKIDETGTLAEILNGNFKDTVTLSRLADAAFLMLLKGALQASDNIANIAKNTGVSADEAQRLQANFALAAANSDKLFITSTDLNKSFAELTAQTGLIADFGGDILVTQSTLTKQLGLSAEAAGKLSLLSRIQSENTEGVLDTTVATVGAISKQNGVALNSKAILEEISNASAAIAVSLGKNPIELAKAASQAKLFGANLATVDAIAGSLLDFESSITKELEAELLIGKDINLENARRLALNNDLAGLSEELANNGAIIESFATGNRIQQEAAAAALGLSRDQLAEIALQQDFNNLSAEQFRDTYGDVTYEQLQSQSASEKFASTLEKIQGIIGDIGIAFAPFLDGLASAVGYLAKNKVMAIGLVGVLSSLAALSIAASIANIFKSFANIPFGAGIPLAFAAAAGLIGVIGSAKAMATADDMVAPAGYGDRILSTPKGSIALNNQDTVVAGTNLGGGDNREAKRTNMLLKQILTKQGTVKIDSTQAGTAFAMNTYQVQ
jgi:hypothetical protein